MILQAEKEEAVVLDKPAAVVVAIEEAEEMIDKAVQVLDLEKLEMIVTEGEFEEKKILSCCDHLELVGIG